MKPHHSETGETHLRSILSTVPDAMIVIDELGLIISFSVAAEKMFGYAENEVVGENVSMLMPSPDRERHDGYLASYRRTGTRRIIGIGRVTTARHRDGSTFPIERGNSVRREVPRRKGHAGRSGLTPCPSSAPQSDRRAGRPWPTFRTARGSPARCAGRPAAASRRRRRARSSRP